MRWKFELFCCFQYLCLVLINDSVERDNFTDTSNQSEIKQMKQNEMMGNGLFCTPQIKVNVERKINK